MNEKRTAIFVTYVSIIYCYIGPQVTDANKCCILLAYLHIHCNYIRHVNVISYPIHISAGQDAKEEKSNLKKLNCTTKDKQRSLSFPILMFFSFFSCYLNLKKKTLSSHYAGLSWLFYFDF